MDTHKQKRSIQPVIFDTDILIFHFRGSQSATDFIHSIPSQQRKIPITVWMELVQGARNKEELRAIEKFINTNFSEVIPLSDIVGMKALHLLERHALPDGLRVVDALIASSALVHDFSLATLNRKHYRPISGLKLFPVTL